MAIEMADKTALVTGATRGIGKETARALARLGATVVVVGRDKTRGEQAVADLRATAGNPHVVFLAADLSSQDEIRRLAREVSERFERLDVLVNNAAVMRGERSTTVDGHEETLAVGHAASVLLTELLLPTLALGEPARVVNVTSGAVTRGKVALDDLQSQRTYHPLEAYTRAKLLNLAWTLQLAERLDGEGVSVFAADPGLADTGTHRDYPRPAPMRAVMRLAWLFLGRRLTVERAALSTIRAATAPELDGRTGVLLDPSGRPVEPPRVVTRPDVQRALARANRELVGLAADGRAIDEAAPAAA